MNKKLRQTLSLLMSTTMIGMQPGISVYAKENNSKLCEHHVEHTEWCHYIEKLGEDSCEYKCDDCKITDDDAKDLESKLESDLIEDNKTEDTSTEEDNEVENVNPGEESDLPEDSIINQENENMIQEEIVPYASAVDPKLVYTEATKSNLDQSGNGSRSNPYNRFEDAVANVADGGTIIIKGGQGAFLNTQDEYGQIPFIIDKDVTIQSEDAGSMADLVVRAGGIVLEGDVTFKNINMQFANKVHDSIFANGYRLEIIDSVRGAGSREVDLFAGSLYKKNSDSLIQGYVYDENGNRTLVTPTVGNDAGIVLKTTNRSVHSQFGKVFAGSMNGDFKGNVDIEIEDGGNLDIVSVHSSGAEEANPGSMFDFEEPAPPQEKPNDYEVDGEVNINLTNHRTNVDGAGATQTHVTFSTQYPMANLEVKDVSSITIENGKLIPDSITWGNGIGDLIISKPNAELDLSNIEDFAINNFTGGGKITLANEGHLTIQGNITGETTFQAKGGPIDGSTSGPVVKDHTYITSQASSGDDKSFQFEPYVLQPGYRLEKIRNEWKAVVDSNQATLPDSLSALEIITDEAILKVEDRGSNAMLTTAAEFKFKLSPELDDPFLIDDLPFEVSISGKQATKGVDSFDEKIWVVDEYGLRASIFYTDDYVLTLQPDSDNPSVLPNSFAPGTYEVELALPDYQLSSTAVLHVEDKRNTSGPQPESSETQIILQANNQVVDDKTPVEFTNKLNVTANIQKKTNSPAPFAIKNEVELIVNGKVIESAQINNQTASFTVDITTDNGFKAGENEIKVLFGGSDTLMGSGVSQKLQVQKVKPNIKLSSNIHTVYDGKPHALTATVTNRTDVTPNIAYYKNSQYTGTSTTLPPVDVGTYYAQVNLPESDMYEAITLQQGMVTLTKATPSIVLSGSVMNNDDATNDLKVYATMGFPEHGRTPVGKIEFICTDGQNKQVATANLEYGASNYTFKGLSEGNYTITANYIPKIEGIVDENYNEAKGIQETFEVVSNFVPVESVSLEVSELELTQNDTGKTIDYKIKPDNATNQVVVWESSNPNIVSINPTTGKMEVNGEGIVFITIRTKDGNYSDSAQLKVARNTSDRVPVESISLNQNNLKLDLSGESTQMLKPSITPYNATNQNIIWKSEDDSIATVDDQGKVIAKSVGRTMIMATTQDGGKTAVCEIQVIDSQQEEVKITDITIKENNLILKKGQRKILTTMIAPLNATDKGLLWTSSKPDVAEVTEVGTIIAKSAGTAIITATARDGSGVTASMTVTVTDELTPEVVPVTGVKLDREKVTLKKGREDTLIATVEPHHATNKEVTWESANPSIVSVDENGNITAHLKGETTITVTTKDGGFTASAKITVTSSSGGSSNSGNNNNNNNSSTETEKETVETTLDTDQNQSLPTVEISQFKDVSNHWAKDDIAFMIEKGLFKGMTKTNFGVNEPMTRGMIVTVLHRLAETPQVGSVTFSDVKAGMFYADAVAWANVSGIVSGVNETEFAPNENITREQLALMLYQYAKSTELVTEYTTTQEMQFKDVDQISKWSKEALQWAVDKGILFGSEEGILNPKGIATRAQVATVMKRFIEFIER